MNYINLDGVIREAASASVSVDTRGFRYGYGLFETMLYCDDKIVLKEYHFERLIAGMKQLHFDLFDPAIIEREIASTVSRNELNHFCRVRLQVFAGPGAPWDDPGKPYFIIDCLPLQQNILSLNENGMQVGIVTGVLKSPDALANLKSCNALIYSMAMQQAQKHNWDQALICNTAGKIIESTIANIFIVSNGHIYTPPLADGCINGVMRRHIIERLAAHSIRVIEESMDENTLLQADEIFLANAIRRIKWIGTINTIAFRNDYTRYIYNLVFNEAG